jgi:hypothetical protein
MERTAPGARLSDFLSTVRLPAGDATRRALRALVSDYVDTVKLQGDPPERVISRLRALVAAAHLTSPGVASPSDRTFACRRELIDDMVGWSIERYYLSPVTSCTGLTLDE